MDPTAVRMASVSSSGLELLDAKEVAPAASISETTCCEHVLGLLLGQVAPVWKIGKIGHVPDNLTFSKDGPRKEHTLNDWIAVNDNQ